MDSHRPARDRRGEPLYTVARAKTSISHSKTLAALACRADASWREPLPRRGRRDGAPGRRVQPARTLRDRHLRRCRRRAPRGTPPAPPRCCSSPDPTPPARGERMTTDRPCLPQRTTAARLIVVIRGEQATQYAPVLATLAGAGIRDRKSGVSGMSG